MQSKGNTPLHFSIRGRAEFDGQPSRLGLPSRRGSERRSGYKLVRRTLKQSLVPTVNKAFLLVDHER